jgi:uncharacterized protein
MESQIDAKTDSKIEARRALLQQEVERYVQILKEKEQPDKVILFGSLATGDVHEWSDIDLVVIKPTGLPFLKRTRALRKTIDPQVALEILCYTPEEFAQLSTERRFFRDEIISKGKVLYDRTI